MTLKSRLFGTPVSIAEASIILIPVPWGVTVPSRSSTSLAPYSVLKASHQIDIFEKNNTPSSKVDISMLPIHYEWGMLSEQLRNSVIAYINDLESGNITQQNGSDQDTIRKVNNSAHTIKERIKEKALKYIKKGKTVSILGGDQSTALGLIEAISETNSSFSVLHIDAHADLKQSYQGFKYSHASVMYNALKLPNIEKIVQVGIRDYSEEENKLINQEGGKVKTFLDKDIKKQLFTGSSWDSICQSIVKNLTSNVYISFDISGLDPKLCPGTGLPVPGGFDFYEIFHLIQSVADAKKKIIGFDLCEVSPGENIDWDALVASKVLYKLAAITKESRVPA